MTRPFRFGVQTFNAASPQEWRDRAKKASKELKMQERKEQTARRKAGEIDKPDDADAPVKSTEE